MVIITINC